MERLLGENKNLEYKVVVPNKSDSVYAEILSKFILDSGSMLPKSTEELLAMFDEGRSVVLTSRTGELIAHGAITFVFEQEKLIEIGGIVVNSLYRKMGYGKMITREVVDMARKNYSDYFIIALCNDSSLPIFLELGARAVEFDSIGLDMSEVLGACPACPKHKEARQNGKVCCDTLVVFS